MTPKSGVKTTKWCQKMAPFCYARGFRGFSPNQRHLDGDVTNAYLAVDPLGATMNNSIEHKNTILQ